MAVQPAADRSPEALFGRHGASVVSDALDMLGIDGGLKGLSRRSASGMVVGRAFTVVFTPVEPGEAAPAADYIDDTPSGSVLILDNAGRTHCTVWGDILTEAAVRRGVRGTVVYGCNRDIDNIRHLNYPLWSIGSYVKSGRNRVRLSGIGEPVTVGGTQVHPGDLVCADGSGVVIVPLGKECEVADRVEHIARIEEQILADLRQGAPLREARRRHGYHNIALRRPES